MIRSMSSRITYVVSLAIMLVVPATTFSLAASKPALYATGWAVLPPLIAIVLSLITNTVPFFSEF